MDLFYLFVKVLYRSGPVGFIVLTLIGASLGHFERNPQTAKDYVDRAQRHLIVNEFEEARANYNQAVKLNPSLAEAYTGRATKNLSKCGQGQNNTDYLLGATNHSLDLAHICIGIVSG